MESGSPAPGAGLKQPRQGIPVRNPYREEGSPWQVGGDGIHFTAFSSQPSIINHQSSIISSAGLAEGRWLSADRS